MLQRCLTLEPASSHKAVAARSKPVRPAIYVVPQYCVLMCHNMYTLPLKVVRMQLMISRICSIVLRLCMAVIVVHL